MKTASINEIKQELLTLAPKQVLEYCLRLARYKKENKELLTYLLFEAHNEAGFVAGVKAEIDEAFEMVPLYNLYQAKKSLRKILRALSKYSKQTGSKQAEVEMLIYFCSKLKSSGIKISNSVALTNLYKQQLKKVNTLISGLHQDLQYDYNRQAEQL